MSALEEALNQWTVDYDRHDCYTILITQQIEQVKDILACASEALSPDTPLSISEARIVCDEGARLLSKFHDHWISLDWKRVLGPRRRGTEVRLRSSLTYVILETLLQWAPFRDLRSDPRSCLLLSEQFIEALRSALNGARDVRLGQRLVRVYMEDFYEQRAIRELEELEEMTSHCQVRCLFVIVYDSILTTMLYMN